MMLVLVWELIMVPFLLANLMQAHRTKQLCGQLLDEREKVTVSHIVI
jgi:hypothetical protein